MRELFFNAKERESENVFVVVLVCIIILNDFFTRKPFDVIFGCLASVPSSHEVLFAKSFVAIAMPTFFLKFLLRKFEKISALIFFSGGESICNNSIKTQFTMEIHVTFRKMLFNAEEIFGAAAKLKRKKKFWLALVNL